MIEIEHLTRRYGPRTVVDDVSMTVERGRICALVGTSGSGKTTLLRMINRLVEPTAGRVRIAGQDTATIPGPLLRRRIGEQLLIPVARGGEDTTLGKPVDGLPAVLAAGGPKIHAGIGVVDGKAGVDKRVHEHRTAGGVAVALEGLGVVVV